MAKRQRRDDIDEQQRAAVIAEFDAADAEATLHAMAAAIVEYRRAIGLLASAVAWAEAQAPFALLRPGPYWKPKQQSIDGSPASE